MRLLKILMYLAAIAVVTAGVLSCAKDDPSEPVVTCAQKLTKLENEIKDELAALVTDTAFTLSVKSKNGNTITYSVGNSSDEMLYRSASTSKLVTAAIILSLVEADSLSLEDSPQEYLTFWPTTGNLSDIKLKHLLNFTSGLANEPVCLNFPGSDFEECVSSIIAVNDESVAPGEEFYYSGAHMQVAGLMAVKASGLSSWQALFQQYKLQTSLFSNSNYDLPSAENPRLAGGMHWNAKDYLEFLDALYNEEILDHELVQQMMSDRLGSATIGSSPAFNALTEDWHYGLGVWIECHTNPNACTETTRVSSPGAYGAYPFIDFENKYYGIFAREGGLGTFSEGYELFESVSDKLELWASMDCN